MSGKKAKQARREALLLPKDLPGDNKKIATLDPPEPVVLTNMEALIASEHFPIYGNRAFMFRGGKAVVLTEGHSGFSFKPVV